MAIYLWEGKTRDGSLSSGAVQGDSEAAVISKLKGQNVMVTKVKLKPKDLSEYLSFMQGGVGTRDVREKSYTFKEGTVVVDVWDRERKVLVWRGMATAAVKSDDERNEKKLDKALAKLMKKWEKMYGGHARALRKLKAEQGG